MDDAQFRQIAWSVLQRHRRICQMYGVAEPAQLPASSPWGWPLPLMWAGVPFIGANLLTGLERALSTVESVSLRAYRQYSQRLQTDAGGFSSARGEVVMVAHFHGRGWRFDEESWETPSSGAFRPLWGTHRAHIEARCLIGRALASELAQRAMVCVLLRRPNLCKARVQVQLAWEGSAAPDLAAVAEGLVEEVTRQWQEVRSRPALPSLNASLGAAQWSMRPHPGPFTIAASHDQASFFSDVTQALDEVKSPSLEVVSPGGERMPLVLAMDAGFAPARWQMPAVQDELRCGLAGELMKAGKKAGQPPVVLLAAGPNAVSPEYCDSVIEEGPDWLRDGLTRLNTTLIAEMTERIVADYQPQKIILFGSYAHGVPQNYSDVDLLIIKETQEKPLDREVAVGRLLSAPTRSVPCEPLVLTPAELAWRLKIGDQFIKHILDQGRVLYSHGS